MKELSIIWVICWFVSYVYVQAKMGKHNVKYPSNSVKNTMPFVLFVAWPYFVIYWAFS